MKNLKIINNGEIEMNALILLGASSKEGDASKIGFFGSGNKYAISTLLRNGIDLRIFSGQEEYVLSTESVYFRGVMMDQILVNGVSTSLTTRTGPQWEVWMALREFICNAIDEGGYAYDVTEEEPHGAPNQTSVYVEYTFEVQDVIEHIDTFVCTDVPVVQKVNVPEYGAVTILEGHQGYMFRKDFRCYKSDMPTLFHYNFDNIAISEERLIRSSWEAYQRITSALAGCTVREVIDTYLDNACDHTYLETQFDSYWHKGYCKAAFSETWKEALQARKRVIISEPFLAIISAEDVAASMIVLPSTLVESLRAQFPELPFYGDTNRCLKECQPSDALVDAVEESLQELASFGCSFPFRIVYCQFVSDNMKAMVDVEEETCYIDISILSCSTELTTILYEEYIHTQGHKDCSRDMQDFLFQKNVELMRRLARKKEAIVNA